MKKADELCVGMTVEMKEKNEITISIEEYTRLKDIETRFSIMRDQMLKAEYCPIHTQIILGIEKEYAEKTKELKTDLFPQVLKEQEGEA